jgi:hypothetical protein
MALWVLVGKMGGGKTLTMTYFLFILFVEKMMRILTNYSLTFPNRRDGYKPEKIQLETLLDPNNKEMMNCAIGLDEFWLFADSRTSASKTNRLISYIMLQSRKRNVDIFITAQTYMQIDTRIRKNADYIIYCKKSNKPGYIRFTIIPRDNPEKGMKTYQIDGSKIYGLYNTNEIIDPTINLSKHKMEREVNAEA